MKVKVVGYTQPAEEFKDKFSDITELVAYCARVSNPSNQFNNDSADKLLQYLKDHKHWSPFEMASITMEIETTRDIARQFLRHRSFAFQEFSQRYSDPTKDMGFELREIRFQDTKNRQNSILPEDSEQNRNLAAEWKCRQDRIIESARESYNWAIDNGIAKEVARCVLPEGNTTSKMYVQGSIRSWIHYISVRTEWDTQLEHRELAKEIAGYIGSIFKI